VYATGDSGRFNSIAIGSDDNPVISFWGGGGSAGLMLALCSNATCTSSTVTTLDAVGGADTSVAIGADNNPIIAHSVTSTGRGGTLTVTTCADTSCTSTTEASQGTTIWGGYVDFPAARLTEMAVGSNGLPVIVFHQGGIPSTISIAECAVADCSSGTEIRDIAASGGYGAVSLTIRDSDQARLISYSYSIDVYIAVLEAP
jgi:hypothetical protein